MKKIKLVSPLLILLCVSLNTYARPGDDIWDDIRALYTGVNSVNASISQVSGEVGVLRTQSDALNTKIEHINNDIETINANKGIVHSLGEKYRGGLIFYIDESGQHGLIASLVDVNNEGIEWRNGESGNKVTNARADGIGAGETNTRLIIAQQTADNQSGQFAALVAANFQVLDDGMTPCKTPIAPEAICYGGWYLPSAYELQLLHRNLQQPSLATFSPEYYWSSTEASVSKAWLQDFGTGEMTVESKANTVGRVRSINRF